MYSIQKIFVTKNPGLTSRGRKLGRGNLPVVSWAAACRAARDQTVVHISADRWPPAPQSAGWTPAWPPGTGRLASPGQLTEKNTLSPHSVLINGVQVLFLPTSLEQVLSKGPTFKGLWKWILIIYKCSFEILLV
jgi:hypothetical protein